MLFTRPLAPVRAVVAASTTLRDAGGATQPQLPRGEGSTPLFRFRPRAYPQKRGMKIWPPAVLTRKQQTFFRH